MKRIFNIKTCKNRTNEENNNFVKKDSSKLAFIPFRKRKTEQSERQMQTSIIMNNQCFIANLKKIAVVTTMVLFGVLSVSAQDTTQVKGIIVNGMNEPVSNVSVGVEGSFELPVITSETGEFTVKVISGLLN